MILFSVTSLVFFFLTFLFPMWYSWYLCGILFQNQSLIISNNPLCQIDDAGLSKYVEEDNKVPNQLVKKAKEFLINHATALNYPHAHSKDHSNFLRLVKNKYYMSLAQPGEPVGIIAAQSIGEPSTQMT